MQIGTDLGQAIQNDVMNQTQDNQKEEVHTSVLKKAQDTQIEQGQEVLKVLESANAQSEQTTAQKTGMGQNINIMG